MSAADRHLLFGLLAVQNGIINQAQLGDAFSAWALDKSRGLADHLEDRGDITSARRALLDALVGVHLEAHGGDTAKSLAAVWAGKSTKERLTRIGDRDIDATLSNVGSDSTDADSSGSGAYSVGSATSDGQRFRVLRPHAHGGLGAVFVALDGELNREVALKQLLDNYADDPVSRQRFLIEAEITGGLEHPGIVPVYGLGSYGDGRPYYAMRFIKGDNLKEAIAHFHADESSKNNPGRRSLELRKLLRRFTDVCNAIDYAHSRGVLHRDIKSGNIIVGKYGETLVVDWGLAKPLAGVEPESDTGERTLVLSPARGSAETLQGSAVGTPAYMSPEQARGELERLGPRSDVFSLGATLYCLLTGRPPFAGHDIGELLGNVQNNKFAPPRQVDSSIDRALEAICQKAMAERPEDRYGSCRAFAEDIDRWAADEPVSAWREPFFLRARRWMRQHRTAVVVAAALLASAMVALIVGLVVVNRERGRTARERDRAENALIEVRREKERADQALIAETIARQRAREVLDDTTSEVVEKFLATQGSKLGPDQEAFLKKMLVSYQEFAAETGDSEESRAAVAKAHARVATFHYKMGQAQNARDSWQRSTELYGQLAAQYPERATYRQLQTSNQRNLALVDVEAGRVKEAEQALRAILEIERRLVALDPSELELTESLAQTLQMLGNLLSRSGRPVEADEAYRSAQEQIRRLVASDPARPSFRASLALLLINRAGRQSATGRDAEAEARFREAVEVRKRLVADFPLTFAFRGEIVVAQNSLARFLGKTGRTAEADRTFREALAAGKQLVAEFPTVASYRDNLAATYGNYAIFCAGSSRPQDAEIAFRDHLALRRQLAADFPSVLKYREGVAAGLTNLGATFSITNRRKEAEAAYREAIAIEKQLVAEVPGDFTYRADVGRQFFNLALILDAAAKLEATRESIAALRPIVSQPSIPLVNRLVLAKGLSFLGIALDHDRQGAEAEASFREAIGLYEGLVARAPKVSQYREEHASCQNAFGELMLDLGRKAAAETMFREATASFERLVADVPNNPHFGAELAVAQGDLADVLADRGEFATALEWLERAAPRIDVGLKANPDRTGYQGVLRTNRRIQARCRAGLGEPAAALAIAGAIGRLGFDIAADNYASARALAQCAPAVGRADPLHFADQAMVALRRAVDAGFRDMRALSSNHDLDRLRDRNDFRLLTMDLAFPAEPFARGR